MDRQIASHGIPMAFLSPSFGATQVRHRLFTTFYDECQEREARSTSLAISHYWPCRRQQNKRRRRRPLASNTTHHHLLTTTRYPALLSNTINAASISSQASPHNYFSL